MYFDDVKNFVKQLMEFFVEFSLVVSSFLDPLRFSALR